jgi:amino acid transporter
VLATLKRVLVGKPRDVEDPHIFHKISLVAFLAWIGLGADGLSSSAYGPDEAFRRLGTHTELAVFLAIATALTVFIISFAYSRIIEHFPTGGGGYVVATKLLGTHAGLVSGSALLIDYVLTITVSIASGADAIFAFLPENAQMFKLPVEYAAIGGLIIMNLRGVKESITVLVPIFVLFLVTHAVMLGSAFFTHYHDIPAVASTVKTHLHADYIKLGGWALFLIFAKAYSMGAGTFTGIEAVSNGLAIMREPKVATGKRTMLYMAVSLALTAGGILLAYQLLKVSVPTTTFSKTYQLASTEMKLKINQQTAPAAATGEVDASLHKADDAELERSIKKGQLLAEGGGLSVTAENGGRIVRADDSTIEVVYDPIDIDKPLNARLLEELTKDSHFFGNWFVVLTLIAEALLLVIAAQTGFIDGPRVMANMALDSWLPHRLSSLSEQLTMHYGVLLMGIASVAALWYTGGSVETLVTMYSINVFITFSLTELGMCKFYITHRKEHKEWSHALPIHMTGLTLCVSILTVVIIEKFREGAWVTLVVTGALILACLLIKRYYGLVYQKLGLLSAEPPLDPTHEEVERKLDVKKPTAVLLVGQYGGLGLHALAQIFRLFPKHYEQILFISVGIIDSGNFKGAEETERLKQQTESTLKKYESLARKMGLATGSMMLIGQDPVAGLEELSVEVGLRYPHSTFFAGQLVFQRDAWYQRFLHNETAFAVQRRLQWQGLPMVVLPVRVWGIKPKMPALISAK